jgi:Flp pilus assembly protein TadB
MNASSDSPNLLIAISSLCVFASTFSVSSTLLQAILSPELSGIDDWNRSKSRWDRLRLSSSVFRSSERWIIGLADLLRRRLPWLADSNLPKPFWIRSFAILRLRIFGRPQKLREAVRVGASKEPWSFFEVVATALLLAGFSTLLSLLVYVTFLSPTWTVVASLGTGWLFYHGYRLHFIRSRERRRREIRRFLPHAMDSIAMVMSSGDPFSVGLKMVIDDFPDEPLCEELKLLLNGLERGQTMESALNRLADTICLPEFRELVRVLDRIQEHGSAGSEDFTRLARQLRITHLRHMEADVGKAEAAMALPIMLVMLSAMVVSAAPFLLALRESDLFR